MIRGRAGVSGGRAGSPVVEPDEPGSPVVEPDEPLGEDVSRPKVRHRPGAFRHRHRAVESARSLHGA
jgi:hypothetical protein